MKREDWEQLSVAIHQRKRQGKKTDVYVNGELQSRDKIRKEISRYHPSVEQRLPFRKSFGFYWSRKSKAK